MKWAIDVLCACEIEITQPFHNFIQLYYFLFTIESIASGPTTLGANKQDSLKLSSTAKQANKQTRNRQTHTKKPQKQSKPRIGSKERGLCYFSMQIKQNNKEKVGEL